MERGRRGQFRIVHYRDRCAYCGQCADNCRQRAIELTSELVQATPQRETLALVVVERGGDSCEDDEA
jgi:formate hydrogenlyase subunit 6/NADH:ubiquinone oxidoreductase subunit I